MKNKMLAITLVLSLIIGVNCKVGNVYALEIESIEEDSENFTQNMEDYEYIEQKVDDELKEDTGLLVPEIEKTLNEQGVFDSEIGQYSEEYMDALNKAEPEDIEVQAQYYEIEDTEALKGAPVSEGELVPASEEVINEYLAEEYYEEDIEEEETEDSSIIEQVLENIGVKPIEVKAETQSKGGQNDKKNKTMLKKTIICTKDKGKSKKKKPYIYVHAIFKWDKMPKYRELDTISIKWDNATYDYAYEKNTSVSHFWTKHQYDYRTDVSNGRIVNNSIKGESVNMKENANYNILKNNEYYLDNEGIRCAVKLHKDTEKGLRDIPYTRAKEYSCEGVGIILYLRKSVKANVVVFYPYYKHIQTKKDWLSVAVNVADRGKFTAVYTLASGKHKTLEESYTGVNEKFKFNFK